MISLLLHIGALAAAFAAGLLFCSMFAAGGRDDAFRAGYKAGERAGAPTPAACDGTQACGDCEHFDRCAWLVRATREQAVCDWDPSRFSMRGARPSDGWSS